MAQIDENAIRRIEELVCRMDKISDPAVRETTTELAQAILSLHGAGLERILELARASGPAGDAIVRRLANDTLVSSLLVLHNLHPDDLATRAKQFLAKQASHAQLTDVFEGVVRVRAAPNEGRVLEALLREALPDATSIVVEERPQSNGFVPLGSLGNFAAGPLLTKS